jgi:hypothetical protein
MKNKNHGVSRSFGMKTNGSTVAPNGTFVATNEPFAVADELFAAADEPFAAADEPFAVADEPFAVADGSGDFAVQGTVHTKYRGTWHHANLNVMQILLYKNYCAWYY